MSTANDKREAKPAAARHRRAERTETAAESLQRATTTYAKFVPFLRNKAGVEFSGRILELGAGPAWFSAELSKLPRVVEVILAEFEPSVSAGEAGKVFKLLNAHERKITRRAANPHHLNFPDNHFDCVVCAGVLHDALNLLHLLREVRRILKPGGQLIAVREPVKPAMAWRAGRGTRAERALKAPLYSRADYLGAFERAGLVLKIKSVSLARGLKYYFDTMFNGLTHARYVFVATKQGKLSR